MMIYTKPNKKEIKNQTIKKKQKPKIEQERN